MHEHGRYPETLDALAEKYFDAVPQDPYSDEEFRYETRAGGYELWSLGPDGEDSRNQAHRLGFVPYDPTNGTLSAGDIAHRVSRD